jgi:serine/threonine-protein kinase
MESGPVKVGDLFQGYQIVRLLGQGGYASVYHARREFIDRDVAIKISHRAVTREVFKRFQAEARLTHRLDHPNIVKVEDAAVATSGHLYIVMELLRGQTFWDARKQYGKLTVPESLHLCAQAADGVEQAHRVGVIHRDLKPLNLFIIAGNRAKVLDFGIAKIPDDGDRSSTQRNVVHGTLKYMSAEQLLGENLTPRSDIYALGVMLFELLTGRHPHIPNNVQPTEAELGFAIVSRPAAALGAIDPSIPSYIAEVVEKALSRDPARRFASMAEFAEALRKRYERYVREFPHLAELRELWIPVPSVSAVVRAAEPPSQEHIATAVVAVVPPQSLRPTVRVGTVPAPTGSEPAPGREPLASSGVRADEHRAVSRVPLGVTPAPVVSGTAIAAHATRTQRAGSQRLRFLTVRRIVAAGAAVGLILGISVTLARLRPVPTPKGASSADTERTHDTAPVAPAALPQPNASLDAKRPPERASAVNALPSSSIGVPSPRKPAPIAQPKPRSPLHSTKAEDRLNWFEDDKRSMNTAR